MGVLSVALVGTAACGGAGSGPGRDGDTLVVAAASSLAGVVDELAARFEIDHPGVDVVTTFDSSTTLASQIIEGAPVDVYAAADRHDMDRLASANALAGEPVPIATNHLSLVVPRGNPAGVGDLGDLATVDGVVALCVEHAPCGRLAGAALADAGVELDPTGVTRGQNVAATLAAVRDGDAVAGVVYRTDAMAAAGSVDVVRAPELASEPAVASMAVTAGAADPTTAGAFTDLVLGEAGRHVLLDAGFGPP